ncbi:MAG TPA: response regulator [Thermodesulfobacteriota bacterium]|nr:response regulator [Thermodesulfobacteriota bacterium]
MEQSPIYILLIEDDEDDFYIIRHHLHQIPFSTYVLDWVSSYDQALATICRREYDICLIDYRLGGRTGLELLKQLIAEGIKTPIILITGQGDHAVDLEAMRLGASDYLVKNQINVDILERAIRYSLERKKTNQALQQHEEQLRLLTARLISTQEAERKTLARDIHDIIGSSLSAFKFKVEATLNLIKDNAPAAVEPLKSIIPVIQESIRSCRRIQSDLRPPVLDDLGLHAGFSWFCREFQSVYNHIRVEQELNFEEKDIPDELKIVIFRITQESFNNLAKYSQADLVVLSLNKERDFIELAIRDNGRGFDPKEVLSRPNQIGGLGFTSMKERADLSGGSLSIESSEGNGTVVKASWPSRGTP